MADDIVGSHEKAKISFGQNGYQGASSLLPGQTKPNIKDVSPPTVSVPDGDWQTRKVDAAPIKSHDGMHPAAPGGKIPTANGRKSRTDGVVRPTKR
jgi:hypothetical protein